MFKILIAMMILVPVQVQAFSVTAQVDRNHITVNDYLELKVIFDGGEGEVDTTPITDFQIVSRSNSSNISIINGNYTKTVTAVFQLIPRGKGHLTIPTLAVSHDGKTYYTQSIAVTVTEENLSARDTRDIFVQAELSHDKLFVGQQGIYKFQLFSAVQFTNARLQKPQFEEFTVEEMGEPRKFTHIINGQRYNGVEIAYLIIPRTPGNITVDPAMLTCDVVLQDRSRRRDPFGDSFFANGFFSNTRTRPRRFSTKALSVEVMPLPPHDGAVPFSGLVGRFKLSASLDNNAIKAGDSTTLTVTVSGTGNVMDAKFPDVKMPQQFKSYDDSPVEEITLTHQGYQGQKKFKRALVPVSPGSFSVPSLGLTFFDVEKKAYQTVFTPSMPMTVAPNADQEPLNPPVEVYSPGTNAAAPRKVTFTGRDILPLKQGPDVLSGHAAVSMPVFMVLYLSPFVLLFFVQFFFRIMNKGLDPRVALAKKAADYLDKGEKEQADDQTFLRHLYMAMMCHILSRAKEKERSMTIVEACDLLDKSGVELETVNQMKNVMHDIESVRYGGTGLDSQAKKALMDRVKAVIKLICLVLTFGIVAFSSPSWVKAAQISDDTGDGTLLLKAVSAYEAGRFEDSAGLFVQLASRGINNGKLYYNAGNAFLKAGDTGRAILWYERAKMQMPHDPDLRFNLAHAGTFVKDKSEAPGFDFTGMLFFWKNYLPPRLMIWTAVGLSVAFALYAGFRTRKGKRVFTLAGLLFFVIMLLAGTTVCYDYYEKNHGRYAVVLSKEASIRSGLSPEATTLFVLHAGTRVRVEEKRRGYLKIIFSRDKIGWVSSGDAEMI
ncbi:BatD family protein [Desulfocicer vacuolatum]|nr:BatD family protein [Desulfocicer vacuolatum]